MMTTPSDTPRKHLYTEWLREKANTFHFAAYRGDLLSIANAFETLERELSAATERAEKAEARAEEDAAASRLIDAWVAEKGKKIPWAKAVQIVAIVTRQSDAERDRLLRMGDEDGSCGMCGRNDATIADLERKLAEAERDAGRYRWLRERSSFRSDPPVVDIIWNVYRAGKYVLTQSKFGHELDAAIDAALETKNAE